MGESVQPYTWLRMLLRKKLPVQSTIPRSGTWIPRYAVSFLGHSLDDILRNETIRRLRSMGIDADRFVWPAAKDAGDFLPQAQHIAAE